MQRPDNDINKHQRTELHRWFSFPSLAAQRAPPSMKEGLRLSDASRGHVDRLTAERDAAKIRRGDVKADGESVMVKDWWVSEAEKRKRARRADELLHSGEMNTRRQKDYERTKAYLARKAEAIEEAGGTWVAKIAMIGGKGKGTEAEMEDEEIGEEEENGESGEESEGED